MPRRARARSLVRAQNRQRHLLDAGRRCRHGRTVRTMILLRHAKSSWSDSTLADIDRPLAPRGKRASRKLAEHIRRKKIQPALVLCSPSRRTRQTLEAVEASLGKRCVVELVPQLYGASEQQLLEQLQALPDPVRSVMVIGHNPGLHDLALVLASHGPDLQRLEEKFPTGALATLVVGGEHWTALGPGAAELVDYVVPRQLG
jgi:phosphohistidine phosphatase